MPDLYETNALQHEGEIAWLADLFAREGVRSYLEIGAKFGGSLWKIACALPAPSRLVAVDLPGGTRAWRDSRGSLERCIARLCEMGNDAHIIWGDSIAPDVIEQVKRFAPFDAVLIDANHTLPYVTKDFATYGPMARMVAFHDIGWVRGPEFEGVRIDVPQFWDLIKDNYRHLEMKLDPKRKDNGIGVLWR